ncbi:D-alanyl-D-alanine carboxypeptidase [Candidatus Daviesbacteria bacterium]|nr:D-alanyl-D-alanine carboxypeptidase [Candidatus Daviesbacteria bacterium]
MKKILLIVILLIIGLSASFFLLSNQKNHQLISPTINGFKQSFADNLWSPKEREVFASENLNITARAAFFVEPSTGEVLFEKNPKEKLPAASLVKIMTTIVTLENKAPTDTLTISDRAASMEPDKMLLKPNERLTVRDLLYGMFLVSANDAAEALAERTTGRREEFINLMNSKAIQLGMKDTHFVNPTGLEENSQDQFSTAYDVVLMSRYAINKWPDLVNITSTPHYYIEQTSNHQDYDLYSGINLLTTYPGVLGFKTGYTPEAGLTLVTYAKRENKEVLGVILGSTNRRDDAKILLDYSFKKLGVAVN